MSQQAPANYVWWLAGRSAGVVALLLLTASVIVGLAMAARVLPPRLRREAVPVHQHLSLLALGAIGAHGLLLAADPWLKAGVTGITVPFTLGYRPLWSGLGIIGGYLAAIFVLSFYVRRRIGGRLWRRMHRFTVVAYVLSLAHALGAGTDASIPLVRYAMLASALPVVVLARSAYRRLPRAGAARGEARSAPRRRRAAHAAARGRAPDLGRKRSSSAALTRRAGSSTRWEPSSSTSTPPSGSQREAARGPASNAAFARTSACRALGASAVACTRPVNAGRPVAGSSRW